jgi:WhiB family transcriptional regulator, redox-sensing transcriptional regulator
VAAELCIVCNQEPVKGHGRCDTCLVYFRRHGWDRGEAGVPLQEPSLTPAQEMAVAVEITRRRLLAYLMHGDARVDGPVGALDLLNRPEWMRWGACRDRPPGRCFPERGVNVRPIKALCSECAVQSECLAFALDDDTLVGIWGGTSAQDRRRLRIEALREVLGSSAAV